RLRRTRKRSPRKRSNSPPTRFRSLGALAQVGAPLLFCLSHEGRDDSVRSCPPLLLQLFPIVLPLRVREDTETTGRPGSPQPRIDRQLEANGIVSGAAVPRCA